MTNGWGNPPVPKQSSSESKVAIPPPLATVPTPKTASVPPPKPTAVPIPTAIPPSPGPPAPDQSVTATFRISVLPSPSKISEQLQQLTVAAQTLNELSDQLTQEVTGIEAILNKLNLGVRAAVDAETSSSDDGFCLYYLRLTFGKHQGKWGLLVEEDTVDIRHGESNETWLFKDAPREYRLKVVDRIPELLEALVKKATDVAAEMTNKVVYTTQLKATFSQPGPDGSKKPTAGSI